MNINLAKELIPNIGDWKLNEIEDLKILDVDELKDLLYEYYNDTGNCSDWDAIQLCVSALYYMSLSNVKVD